MKKHREKRRARRAQDEFLYMIDECFSSEDEVEIPVYTIRTIRP